jgi:stage III sporulation protein SpoIIIAA
MKAGTVLLVAGRPGVGKTTVIRKVADALPRESLAGFYTEEVREHGRRRGFRAVTFDGWTRIIDKRLNTRSSAKCQPTTASGPGQRPDVDRQTPQHPVIRQMSADNHERSRSARDCRPTNAR